MWIDFHSHILPDIDDGAVNVDVSIKMLRQLRDQGVECVALTPHFYAHCQSVEDFLVQRQNAFDRLLEAIGDEELPTLLLGAEVSLECDLEQVEHLDQLCLEGTPFLMIELPVHQYMPWMLDKAISVCHANGALPMLAHVDRYIGIYPDEQLEKIATDADALLQLNVSSLGHWTVRKRMVSWINSGRPVVFGSDAHNTTTRKPRFDKGIKQLCRKVSAATVEKIQADSQIVLQGKMPEKFT